MIDRQYMKKRSSASVLLYVLMFVAAMTMLLQHMLRSLLVSSAFVKTMVNREKAVVLATSGLSIALAQLSLLRPDSEKKEDGKKGEDKKDKEPSPMPAEAGKEKKGESPIKKFFAKVYPHLNRWQSFNLTEKIDGFDGRIDVCITCEQGKINLNEVFDFSKMEFKKPFDAILKGLAIPGKLAAGQLLARLTQFFKERKRKLDDLSELCSLPELKPLDIFYLPLRKQEGIKKIQPSPILALLDIFTLWSGTQQLEMVMLSDAMCAIFGLRRALPDDSIKRQEKFTAFAQKFDPSKSSNWDDNWNVIEPIYEQKPKVFSELKGIFTKEFGPTEFSVLCCGKVGNVEQRLMAWISLGEDLEEKSDEKAQDGSDKKKEAAQATEKQAASKQQKTEKKWFKINKLYWL